jgi:hypothetical protein
LVIARLTDPWFEAEFGGQGTERGSWRRQGGQLDGAQLLFLWCPCAFGNDSRAHGLMIPFANPRNAAVTQFNFGITGRDGKTKTRWQMSGTGLSDLTLSPSVDVGEPSCWHGYITQGEVR